MIKKLVIVILIGFFVNTETMQNLNPKILRGIGLIACCASVPVSDFVIKKITKNNKNLDWLKGAMASSAIGGALVFIGNLMNNTVADQEDLLSILKMGAGGALFGKLNSITDHNRIIGPALAFPGLLIPGLVFWAWGFTQIMNNHFPD